MPYSLTVSGKRAGGDSREYNSDPVRGRDFSVEQTDCPSYDSNRFGGCSDHKRTGNEVFKGPEQQVSLRKRSTQLGAPDATGMASFGFARFDLRSGRNLQGHLKSAADKPSLSFLNSRP